MNLAPIFQNQFEGKVLFQEPLSKHTTIRVGGPADVMICPKNTKDVIKAIRLAKENQLPLKVIGRGSNLLVCDEGIRGVVLKISDCMDEICISGNEVMVGAGYSFIKLATQLSKKGFDGLTFASGIPGSVGGAVYMNAGAHKNEIAQIVKKVQVLDEDGHCHWLTSEEMQFQYRTSILQTKPSLFCLQVILQLQKGNKEQIMKEIEKNKTYRKTTQPWDYPNCGSVFRNPLPKYAGQLIEQAGLKGFCIGKAMVSEKHANFIVNIGGATAKDIFDLISYIQDKIFSLYQIQLKTEVEVIKK